MDSGQRWERDVGSVYYADGIAVCPRSWVTHGTTYPPDFLASLQRLLELPVEIVLLSHGAAVLSGGHALLHRAVDAVAE